MPQVVTPGGGILEVSEAELAERQGLGYRVATEEDLAAAAREEKYGGISGVAGSVAAGALRGATMGLSDVAGAELGLGDDLQALREVNPLASMGGEVGGGLLGAGKLKGAGMGVRALRGLSAPARLATRAGTAAGRLAGGGARGMAATGLVEGALFGAGSAVSEAALTNQPLTAELIASQALQGAAFGGAIGGGLGLAGRGLRKGYEGLAKAVHGHTPKGFGDAAADLMDRMASGVGSAEPGAVRGMLTRGRGGRYGFDIATNADDIVARSADDITEAYRGVMQAEDAIERNFSGALKHKNIAKLVREGEESVVHAQTSGLVGDVRAFGDDLMTGDLKAFTKGSELGKNFRHQLEVVEDLLNKGPRKGFNADAFMELDALKREVGKVRQHLQGKLNRGGSGRIREAAEQAEGMYSRLRSNLQDQSIWGEAASVQARLNKPWSELIPTKAELRKRLTNKGTAGKWGATTHEVSRDKVGGWLKELRNPDTSDTHAAVRSHLEGLERFADEARQALDLSPADRKAVEELAGNVQAMREKLDDASDAITKANQLKDMAEAGHDGAATIGALLGGAPGAVAGKALDVAFNPARGIRQLANIHALMSKTEGRVGKGLAKLMDNAGPNKALRAVTGGAIRAEAATDDPLVEARVARKDPALARERLAKRMANAAMGAPDTTAMAVDKAAQIQQLLAEGLPVLPDDPFMGGESQVPPWAKQRFDSLHGVLTDPPSVIEGIRSGKVTPRHMAAFRTAYPEMYADMQQKMADHLVGAAAQGKLLPYRERVAVGVLWELPTDPMLRALPQLQAAHTAPMPEEGPAGLPPKKPTGPAPDIAEDLKTGVEERLESGA